ncbi:nucleotide exchange factor GrpE [bacterium]|nr:nucleotide exchange factor GrpE [bacterium]
MSKHKHDFKAQEGQAAPAAAAGVPESGPVPPQAEEVSAAAVSPVPEGARENARENAAAEPAVSAAVAAELESAKGEIASLRAEVAELNEKYLRKLADEVNFRKRMAREKEETQKYAVASLLGDLIPILDDFDRGISSSDVSKSFDQLHEGVVMIRKQLSQMLENKYALQRFEPKGKPFDPNRHEALFAEPSDVEEPMVSEVYLPGYALHDRVLRTAKVRVRIPGAPQAPSAKKAAPDGAAGQA